MGAVPEVIEKSRLLSYNIEKSGTAGYLGKHGQVLWDNCVSTGGKTAFPGGGSVGGGFKTI